MTRLSLNGKWTVTPGDGGERSLPATVPGDAMTDLLAARRIDDPFLSENERDVQWVGERDWIYERVFQASADLLREAHVMLECDGLDTLATVELNGRRVVRTDNMHRRYAWEVKRLLRPGRNAVRVTFQSVNAHTRRRFQKRPIRSRVREGHPAAYPAWIRKMACNFGWDWGPILVTAGIWRDIRLVGFSGARLAEVVVSQEHAEGRVRVGVGYQVSGDHPGLSLRATILAEGRVVDSQVSNCSGCGGTLALTVRNPHLWWPRGMGGQPLYDLTVELLEGDRIRDTVAKRIGLRTLRLDRHPDTWGESFQFVANGVPFFAKGANWIPIDALMGRRKQADYQRLVGDAAAVNMNMLRVLGRRGLRG